MSKQIDVKGLHLLSMINFSQVLNKINNDFLLYLQFMFEYRAIQINGHKSGPVFVDGLKLLVELFDYTEAFEAANILEERRNGTYERAVVDLVTALVLETLLNIGLHHGKIRIL